MNRPTERRPQGLFAATRKLALVAFAAAMAVQLAGAASAQSWRYEKKPAQSVETLNLALDKSVSLDAPGARALQTLADLRRFLRREVGADLNTEGISLRRSIAISEGVWTPRALVDAASVQTGGAWSVVDGGAIKFAATDAPGEDHPAPALPPAALNAGAGKPAAVAAPAAPTEAPAPAQPKRETARDSSQASPARGRGVLQTLGSFSPFGSVEAPADGGAAPSTTPEQPEATPKKADPPRKPLVIPIIVPIGQKLFGLIEPMFKLSDVPAALAQAEDQGSEDRRMASADAAPARSNGAPLILAEPMREAPAAPAAPMTEPNALAFAPAAPPSYAIAAATGLPSSDVAANVVETLESAGFVTAVALPLGGEFGWSVALAEPVSPRVEDLLPARDALLGFGFPESVAIDARLMAFADR